MSNLTKTAKAFVRPRNEWFLNLNRCQCNGGDTCLSKSRQYVDENGTLDICRNTKRNKCATCHKCQYGVKLLT